MTLRYQLRSLLILLAVLPPLLAVGWWKYSAWREAERQRLAREQAYQDLIRLVDEMLEKQSLATPTFRNQPGASLLPPNSQLPKPEARP